MSNRAKISVALLEAYLNGKITRDAVYKIAKLLSLRGFGARD